MAEDRIVEKHLVENEGALNKIAYDFISEKFLVILNKWYIYLQKLDFSIFWHCYFIATHFS